MKDGSLWWRERKGILAGLCEETTPLIVYNEETLNDLFFDLLSIDPIDRCLYPVVSNPYPGIIKKAFDMGLDFLVRNNDEEKRVRVSCPGLSSDRVFFGPKTGPFSGIFTGENQERSPLILNTMSLDIFKDTQKTRDSRVYYGEVEKLKEEYPDLELWLTCDSNFLSSAGILLMRVTDQMKEQNGFIIPVVGDLQDRLSISENHSSMQIFNVTGHGQELRQLKYEMKTERQAGELKLRIKRSKYIKEGDVILITDMGACAGLEEDNVSASGNRGKIREHFLRARRLCRVKI